MKYDYKCKEHGVFEISHSIAAATGEYNCPECEAVCRRHFVTPPSVVFHGLGWTKKISKIYKEDLNRKKY